MLKVDVLAADVEPIAITAYLDSCSRQGLRTLEAQLPTCVSAHRDFENLRSPQRKNEVM